VHHSWAWFIVSVNSSHIARKFDQEIARVALQSTRSPYSTTSLKRPTSLAGVRGTTFGNSKLHFGHAQVTTMLTSLGLR
jgi:hypothetical protein